MDTIAFYYWISLILSVCNGAAFVLLLVIRATTKDKITTFRSLSKIILGLSSLFFAIIFFLIGFAVYISPPTSFSGWLFATAPISVALVFLLACIRATVGFRITVRSS